MHDYLDSPPDISDLAWLFDELSFWASHAGRLLLDNLALRPDLRVLDLGCGAGFPLLELAHRHGASCHVVGVDLWEGALHHAERKRRAHALPTVALLCADGARLPLPDGTFDLLVSNLGVNNFADPPAALAECSRVAAPTARLVLTTNLYGHMAEFYTLFRETLHALEMAHYLHALAAQESHRVTEARLRAMVEAAGFWVTRTVPHTLTLRYVDGSALLRHPLTRFGFLPGWLSLLDPADQHPIFTALEERLNAYAREADGLAMTVPLLYLEAERQRGSGGEEEKGGGGEMMQ